MFKTLLINQINKSDLQETKKIFFLLGDMDNIFENLLDVFNNKESKYYGKVTFRYNGISIIMPVYEIPNVIKKLVEMNINIFSIYEIYEPE